jgi:hypothetical protein
MTALDPLAAGGWSGTSTLQDPHSGIAETSASPSSAVSDADCRAGRQGGQAETGGRGGRPAVGPVGDRRSVAR